MRDIKFRAWDKKRLCWFNRGYGSFSVKRNGIVYDYCSGHGDSSEFLDFDVIALTQYAGLKDRNGVEIYGADVVSDYVGIGVVEYIDSKAAFRVNYKDGHAKWFIDYLPREQGTIEVIGNRFENPELLEQSK